MTLSKEDGQLFYELWIPLLDYTNKKHKINKRLKNITRSTTLDPQDAKEIANVLWDNTELIDQYLSEDGKDLPDEHKQIVTGWKCCVQGRFIMERHLKKGSIFISLEDEKVYQVNGIVSSWEEMVSFAPMPVMLEATFIPFRDVIISDGLVMPYNIIIGSNMKKQFKDIYMDAKKNGTLIRSLKPNDFTKPGEGKSMLKQKWKRFHKLTDKCYNNLIGIEKDWSCWRQSFDLLMEIVQEERADNPEFAPQIELLDDATDYEYDIQGWLEDCLDEIEMRNEHDILLKMCDDLLHIFEWPEYTGSDLKFRKVDALNSLGRNQEAVEYARKWISKEPENIVAATAGVYAFIYTKEFAAAEELVDKFILDRSECLDENDIMFTAASKLYEAMGKRKEKKQIDKAIEEYDDYLEQYFEDPGYEDEALEFWDDDLPFN